MYAFHMNSPRYPRYFLALILAMALLLPTVAAHAQEIRVGIGFSIPPYVIKKSDMGVEVDIIREALKRAGHEAVFIYLPNLRLPVEYAQGSVDCIASNAAYDLAEDSGREAFSSEATIVFQNYAVTLRDRNLSITSISDLKDKRVLGFNNAAKYLGPEFAAMAESNLGYSELADQSLQVRLLYSHRTDVVVSDKRIFLWWRQKLAGSSLADSLDLDRPLVFNAIFPPAPRHVSFGDASVRNAFNEGLAAIKNDGTLDAIVARYIDVQPEQ